jgi:diguanylate cyclase (GGDEF)-like protein
VLVDAGVVAGLSALVIAALLTLLYAYRRRPFILCWIAAWLLLAASFIFPSRHYADPRVAATAYGISQFVAVVGTLVLVLAADAYRHPLRLRRAYGLLLLPIAIWFLLAPLALGTMAVFVPGHLLVAGGFAVAAGAHLLLLRSARLIGAIAVGIALLALAGVHLWVAAKVPGPDAPAAASTTAGSAALFLLAALGMQLMTFEDMTYELRRTNRRLESAQGELRELVTTDALTGCRNRRYFSEVIQHELRRHQRYKLALAIMFIDIDRFKTINDTLGHDVGDSVLQQTATFLIKNVRDADYVFRWGGDEFLILITANEKEARRRGADLQAAFAASPEVENLPDGVGLSVGCVQVPTDTADIMAFVQSADEQMYADKKRRRR